MKSVFVRILAVSAFAMAPIAVLAPMASASDIPTFYDQTANFANPGDPGSQNKQIIVSPFGTSTKIVCGGVTGNYQCHQSDPNGGAHNLTEFRVPSTSTSGVTSVWVFNPAFI